MVKPKVFISRTILDEGLQLVQDFCEAEIWPGELPPTHDEIISRVRGRQGLLCLLTDRVDSAVMQAAGPALKVISNCAAGVDNVDVTAATARRIPVGNTPDVLTEATADFTFALLMAAARRLSEGESQVHSGAWKTWSLDTLLGVDIAGSTLGLVGFGRIGRAVARRAAGFNTRILYSDPESVQKLAKENEPNRQLSNATRVDFETLLRESDFVSLHVPLTAGTRGLINSPALALMKPNSILVNTSRGAVVDHTALYEALKARRIFAAALDVTDPEPLPLNSPLLELENCIITPHIASASLRTRSKMSRMAAENLIAGLKGERLPNCVNPEVYHNR
jgi:glyoxylate reductase